MLSRGFYDAVVLWPIAVWPIIFSSCFYAYLRLSQLSYSRHGFGPIGGRRRSDRLVTYLGVPFATVAELAAHGYMLMVGGYMYLIVAIPIYVFGWILLPATLDGLRSAPSLLIAGHVLFVAAFVVLLGFADVSILRVLNGDLYAMLTGLPVTM